MAVFLLTPIEDLRWHADWSSSEHEGECYVFAEDEDHARRLAARRFRAPLVPPYVDDPWTQPSLVRIENVTGRCKAPRFPLGTVVPVMSWVVQ